MPDVPAVPRSPTGLGATGRALWRSVLAGFDLDQHELTLLREACRTADSLDALQARLDNDGVMSHSSQGTRVHPALVELRQQRIAFARLLTALRVPADATPRRSSRRLRDHWRCGMRRRSEPEPNDIKTPAELRRFEPKVWGTDRFAPNRWYAARLAWQSEHGEYPYADPDAVFPDAAFDPSEI